MPPSASKKIRLHPSRFEGCLLGLMAGDALGLPREGLSRRRAERLFGAKIDHHFLFRRGMISDDTEQACLVAQALIAANGNLERFEDDLCRRLRWWLLGLPVGIGLATLRTLLRLWLGRRPPDSAVLSAGNGPAMKSALLGLAFCNQQERLKESVHTLTRITHADPRAERGALAVALAARYGATHGRENFIAEEFLYQLSLVFPPGDREGRQWRSLLLEALNQHWSNELFFEEMGFGKGVSGFVYHTVPAALWAWLVDPFDFMGGMRRVMLLGGDTDTTGAVFGAICGATVGPDNIPQRWIADIVDYPRSPAWVRRLARRLHVVFVKGERQPPLPLNWPLLLPRNLLFLAVVLLHGLRRLLPPY